MESPFKSDVLKGKVALLTGGGSGIGFEISSQFGKHGASIAIMGRRKNVLDDAVSALTSLGIPVLYLSFFYLFFFLLTCFHLIEHRMLLFLLSPSDSGIHDLISVYCWNSAWSF